MASCDLKRDSRDQMPTCKTMGCARCRQVEAQVDHGATALPAAAAFGRPLTSVKRKANDLGIPLPSVRKVRAHLREMGPSRLDDATGGSIIRARMFFMDRQANYLATVLLHN